MNIAIRKLMMLEKAIDEKLEAGRIQGYSECPVEVELKQNIAALLLKVRTV